MIPHLGSFNSGGEVGQHLFAGCGLKHGVVGEEESRIRGEEARQSSSVSIALEQGVRHQVLVDQPVDLTRAHIADIGNFGGGNEGLRHAHD
ncbi:hypothetical protein ACQ86G_24620 [Roseateles chitinivorans]|uniref:hypothetical protein n=1 Tax=Roseateles chitinivorans TaxID=2917965 RepID=UPI003D6648DA